MGLCNVCKREDCETRPYGRGGSDICFECAMGSEESKREAERQFSRQMDRAEGDSEIGVSIIGTENGPLPIKPRNKT